MKFQGQVIKVCMAIYFKNSLKFTDRSTIQILVILAEKKGAKKGSKFLDKFMLYEHF